MASNDPPDSSAVPYPEHRVTRLSRRFGHLLDEILLKRTNYHHELQNRDSYLDLVRDSMTMVEHSVRSTETPEDQPMVNERRRQRDSDYRNLQLQETKLATIRDDLSRMEFRLYGMEKSMRKVVDHVTQRLPEIGESSDILDLDLSDTASETSSTSETPTLLAEYYDHQGQAEIFTERLQELEMEHSASLVQRDLLRDQEQVLAKTDEQFEREYDTQRQAIISDLAQAREKAEMSASRCTEAGLDTLAGPVLETPTAIERDFDDRVSVAVNPSQSRTSLARIGGWMQSLVADPVEDQDMEARILHEQAASSSVSGSDDHDFVHISAETPEILPIQAAEDLQLTPRTTEHQSPSWRTFPEETEVWIRNMQRPPLRKARSVPIVRAIPRSPRLEDSQVVLRLSLWLPVKTRSTDYG